MKIGAAIKKLGFLLVVFFTIAPFIPGLEMEIGGGMGNLAFNTELEKPLDGKAFVPNLFASGKAFLSGEIWKTTFFRVGYERDIILRNRVVAVMGLRLEDVVTLEVGPALGIFNSEREIIDPGIIAGVNVNFPGIVFAKIQFSSSLGSDLTKLGNYSQKSWDLSAGFWVPFAVCSLNLQTRTFSFRKKADLLVEDALNRYFFRADVYTKNVPYTIKLDLGYQNLKRSYSSPPTNEFNSIILGMEATWTASRNFAFVLGGEISVYNWSAKPMENLSRDTVLYEAHAGIILTFGGE
jgi:hypothetical protein